VEQSSLGLATSKLCFAFFFWLMPLEIVGIGLNGLSGSLASPASLSYVFFSFWLMPRAIGSGLNGLSGLLPLAVA
jgi:hypothetical protein